MTDTTIADETYTLRKADNGYILERGWKEVKSDGEFDYRWKDSKSIFLTYNDAIEYMKTNII
jgi:hypothetical protein